MIIIGITGTFGAGKGTIVDYLVKTKNFKHYSVRELLTKTLKKRKKKISIENLVGLANELREKYGPEYIAKTLYEQALKTGKDSIIESLRSVGEIEELKKKDNFFLFSVDADPKIRYKRLQSRALESDKIPFKKFIDEEKKQFTSKDPTKPNLKRCISLANVKFKNNGTIEELQKKVELALKNIDKSDKKEIYKRPTWHDYFMEVAEAISKRATCDRGRSGCVIAKDKQILATGYVGSPVGLPHCDDIGHQMKKIVHEDGSVTQHCVRTVHAEQNAICQAAKRGIPVDGATVYCRMTPCRTCAMLLINSGIKDIYCERKYHAGKESEEMFKKAGIKIKYKYNELQQYKNQ